MKKLLSFFITLPVHWYLIGITIIATLLRSLSITKAAIWHDEGYTALIATFSPLEIIGHAVRDFHPPLYALTVHGWTTLFGTSELGLRSLSLVCGVGTVILIYFIMKRLGFRESIARVATLLAAFAPFLIRYSQEARMYGMAALLVCAATLTLLIALDYAKKGTAAQRYGWWIGYGVLMAAAIYTHYYAAFIVFAHIGYAWHRYGGFKNLIRTPAWWTGNLAAVALFLPWIPTAIEQFTRVQKGYWIPPISAETIPNTVMQFVAFSSNLLNSGIEFLIVAALVCLVTVLVMRTTKPQRPALWFVIAWVTSPLLIAFIISIVKQPVYYDRYFIYSAAAFSCLIAILIMNSRARSGMKALLIGAVLLLSTAGTLQVAAAATHKMNVVAAYVAKHAQPNDFIISGELYTYFDFRYYNSTDLPVHLYSANNLIPTGESSLIYDDQEDIVTHDLRDINTTGAERVWMVGKTGEHDYDTTLIPNSWQLVSVTQAGDSSLRLYTIR